MPTLLSLVSLSLPYVARLGMLGPNWNVGQIRVLRLVANGPLIATVVGLVVYDVIRGMFRFSESSSVFTGNGVGAGAWFGLAGALLAAQPRAAEIRIDPRTAPRWLAVVKPLVFVAWGSSVASALVALIYILVSASRYRYYDGPQTFESLIVLFVSSAVPIVVVGVAAVGLARRFASWRLTIAALGIALLAAGCVSFQCRTYGSSDSVTACLCTSFAVPAAARSSGRSRWPKCPSRSVAPSAVSNRSVLSRLPV